VSRQRFREQMTLLRDERYAVVPLNAVFGPDEADDRVRVAITFDDGYRSQKWAATVLREFQFPATFFVVPRFLDGMQSPVVYWEEWEYLTWGDAATLIEEGFDIGAHSITHLDLRKCADAQLEKEVSGARTLLGQRLGTTIANFSYPHGGHDGRVRRAVERAGYRLGCTSRYGLNRRSGSAYSLRRTEVVGTDELEDFRLKVHGQYDWLGYWQDLR
jgi:peptidoglycan/xylan/chitin deacetylase (PgdA/CDA1 family)